MKNTIKEVQSFEQLEFCMKQKHLAPEEMVSSVPTHLKSHFHIFLHDFKNILHCVFTSFYFLAFILTF